MNFGLRQREWQGPVAHEFKYYSGHTKTTRYRCDLKEHPFDFYAPLFMLKGLSEEEIPERIQVVIWRSESPSRTCGYLSEPLPLRLESDVLEYEFKEAKANSKRYDFVHKSEVYAIYIPNEIFGDYPNPKRVYVQMAVSEKN
ncbi:MAG: hypothetical protein Q7J73_10660 [Dehalococcoidales bacterium]|nr:hypothetical protein [Dehalococcoidales bacterium]